MRNKLFISIFCCFILFYCIAQTVFTDQEMDIGAIIAGLRKYNELIQSGSADIIYTTSQYSKLGQKLDSMVSERHIVFNRNTILVEINEFAIKATVEDEIRNIIIPRRTFLAKKSGVLIVSYVPKHGNYYQFQSHPIHPEVLESDPRHLTMSKWGGTLPDYIAKKNFKIKSKEVYDNTLCYVLEHRGIFLEKPSLEWIWVSPARGFGYLKNETWSMLTAIPSHGFEEGVPGVSRDCISYQQSAGVWFPEKWQFEISWIDDERKEHPRIKQGFEVRNLRLNYKITKDAFTVEIPDNANIRVSDLDRKISKQEFLNYYPEFNED